MAVNTAQNRTAARKASCVLHGTSPTGDDASRAGRKGGVLLVAPSAALCDLDDKIEAFQMPWWLYFAH